MKRLDVTPARVVIAAQCMLASPYFIPSAYLLYLKHAWCGRHLCKWRGSCEDYISKVRSKIRQKSTWKSLLSYQLEYPWSFWFILAFQFSFETKETEKNSTSNLIGAEWRGGTRECPICLWQLIKTYLHAYLLSECYDNRISHYTVQPMLIKIKLCLMKYIYSGIFTNGHNTNQVFIMLYT